MSIGLIAVAVILAIGLWGYLQQGDPLYVINKLSASDIATVASGAGFQGQDLTTAVAIALAESGGDPQIEGDKSLAPTAGPSIGLWQINIGSKANPQYASVDLTDPATNASAAFAIYSQSGFNFNRWATYTVPDSNGILPYTKYLDQATAATGGESA